MIIGLTGTIGSGKSAVASILEDLGAFIIDTDVIAREVVEPETKGWKSIVDRWGRDILDDGNRIDRKKLASIVFANESERKQLNSIMHPLIADETAKKIAGAQAGKHVILVVPLLFESGFDKLTQRNWVVIAEEKGLAARIRSRDGCTETEAVERIRTQMPQSEKINKADVVIDNSGTLEETRIQVEKAWREIEKV